MLVKNHCRAESNDCCLLSFTEHTLGPLILGGLQVAAAREGRHQPGEMVPLVLITDLQGRGARAVLSWSA